MALAVNGLTIITIIINNFFFVGIMQDYKIIKIVFRSKKLIKANYKPSKMKVLKDIFQQSFKRHIYRWKLKKKKTKKTRANAHIFACTHKHTLRISISAQASTHTHAHIDYRPNYIII